MLKVGGLRPLDVDAYRHIVVLTGAGISASAGLQPFRGAGAARWHPQLDMILDARALPRSLDGLWQFADLVRERAQAAAPTAAHRLIANLAHRGDERSAVVVTQNVDRLHQRAGSPVVHELHGSVFRARCTARCGYSAEVTDAPRDRRCPRCGAPLRPAIVLYGEHVDAAAHHLAKRALRDADLFLAVGTSGVTDPAAQLGRVARDVGARCILVNLEPHAEPAPWFQQTFLGPADEVLPTLLAGRRRRRRWLRPRRPRTGGSAASDSPVQQPD